MGGIQADWFAIQLYSIFHLLYQISENNSDHHLIAQFLDPTPMKSSDISFDSPALRSKTDQISKSTKTIVFCFHHPLSWLKTLTPHSKIIKNYEKVSWFSYSSVRINSSLQWLLDSSKNNKSFLLFVVWYPFEGWPKVVNY